MDSGLIDLRTCSFVVEVFGPPSPQPSPPGRGGSVRRHGTLRTRRVGGRAGERFAAMRWRRSVHCFLLESCAGLSLSRGGRGGGGGRPCLTSGTGCCQPRLRGGGGEGRD